MAEEEKETPAEPEVGVIKADGRSKVVPLDWPVDFGGKTWTEVTVRRVTGLEVERYMDALQTDSRTMPPMYDFPRGVYDGLDDDDRVKVDEAVLPFMPRRFQVAARAIEQSLQPGGSTSDS